MKDLDVAFLSGCDGAMKAETKSEQLEPKRLRCKLGWTKQNENKKKNSDTALRLKKGQSKANTGMRTTITKRFRQRFRVRCRARCTATVGEEPKQK